MKFIKNSIDSEYLQDSLSDADLENQMANCEVKPEVLNGHNSDGIKISNKTNMEGIEVTKLSNGIHGKSGSPTKCNGKVNGFYEEEEDFNLVLEDSSEGSESPSKKIDDDSISAPQIVQEIEDLLGITSSSAGIQEELNNLDGTESMEDCLDNVEDIEDSQDIQEVFEEIDVNKVKECKGIDDKKVEKIEEVKKLPGKTLETSECDTHMNLVFDEVEVGMENGDLSTTNESNSTTKPGDTECNVESTTEAKPEKVKYVTKSETKDTTSKEDDTQGKNSEKCDVSIKSSSDEITSTQSSSVSGNSEEWMVLDATETSEEDKLTETQESSGTVENLVDNLPLEQKSESKDEIISEADCSLSLPNDNETVENLSLAKSSENNELKSDADCILSVQHDNLTVETLAKQKVIPETTSSPSLLVCEGDGVRKRCASVDDEEVELKKPKLEDQSCLVESSSPVLKRPSSVTTENESKRTKLSENTEECDTLIDEDCKVNEKSDNVSDEEQLMTVENESMKDNQISDVPMKSTLENQISDVPMKSTLENQISDVPIKSTSEEKLPLDGEENLNKNVVKIKSTLEENPVVDSEENLINNLVTDKIEEINTTVSSFSKTPNGNEDVNSPTVTEQSPEKLISDVSAQVVDQKNKVDSISSKVSSSSQEDSKKTLEEDEHSLITTCQTQLSKEILSDSKIVGNEKPERKSEDNPPDCEQKIVSDENKENVSSSSIDTSKEEVGFKLDDLSSITNKGPSKSDQAKIGYSIKTENKTIEPPKLVSITKELSTSIKELERSLNKSGYEKIQDSRDLKDTGSKKMTNLDFAIERVVEKARIQTEKKVPILKKFHKDQLKKLKRSELEDVVVSKICEAVTYKSEIGQMRLRTQNLEETNEMWRKKVQQIEKQNRELEMVLKRFLAELAHIKRENQNKVPMPIKVTRSVGLQVVLASSMHGALVTSRSKMNSEVAHQQHQHQQQQAKVRQPEKEKEKVKEPVKATTFMPPNQSTLGRGRGRPPKALTTPTSRPSTPQTLPPKITPPTTPAKAANTTPVKTIQTPNKDLEVIDLTDKEERAKSTLQLPVSGSIRVAPSTQMCFVQQSVASSSPQQPLYLVQKAGQRPQFLVAASSASPQRPISNVSRPPPALALPVFRAGGHLIPVQTSSQMGVKTSTNTAPTAMARQIPTSSRIQQQSTVNKHPAPLPSAPAAVSKPGMKAPPPKPQLKIAKTSNGIMLSWSMSLTKEMAEMQSYQLYAYQEGNQPPSTGLWKKVGDVKALPLPMACTLTQFIEGHKYHFAVRAVDTHGRIGPFSTPSSILLTK